MRPIQNGRHFADDIFKCISLNENLWISNKISLKCAPLCLIDNMAELVQIMDWRQLSETMLVCSTDAYMRHSHICISIWNHRRIVVSYSSNTPWGLLDFIPKVTFLTWIDGHLKFSKVLLVSPYISATLGKRGISGAIVWIINTC